MEKEEDLVKNINIINKNKLKILHISTFDERNDHRLFNISIANKLSKGLIRNDHDVINFSYRSFLNKNLITKNNKLINQKTISICDNYRPDMIVCGHNNILERNTILNIKKKYRSKLILWYEDALGHKGNGPNWSDNLRLIEKNHDLIDSYFLTTHPSEILTKIKKNKMFFYQYPLMKI